VYALNDEELSLMREFPLVVSPNINQRPHHEDDLCLNVRFWAESFDILRSQRCDLRTRNAIEWSDMNEAEMRVIAREIGFCPGPARFSYTRPCSIEVG
jgi:hypothetical protein